MKIFKQHLNKTTKYEKYTLLPHKHNKRRRNKKNRKTLSGGSRL